MKRALKIIGIGIAGLLSIGVAVVAFLFAWNLRDDALDPEVARLMAMSPPQIAAADNGYFAWTGVAGQTSEPPHAWGRRWYQQALESDKRVQDEDSEVVVLLIDHEKRGESFTSKDLLCDKPETCLDEVASAPEQAAALVGKAAATLSRGDEAMQFPAYQEAWRPDFNYRSSFPPRPSYWQQLAATRFALAATSGRHDEALALLERQMQFHVRQLRGATTLIEKIIAVAGQRNDYQLLNRYIQRYPEAARRSDQRIAEMLKPLPADALSMTPAMTTECRATLRLFLTIKDEALRKWNAKHEADAFPPPDQLVDLMAMPLYLPNATANEQYRAYLPVLDLAGKSGDAYRQALAAMDQSDAGDFGIGDVIRRNPTGHILVRIGMPATLAFQSYFFRRDDLLVLRAGVALQLDLLRGGIVDDDSTRRAIRDADLVHPFTGERPVWNGARRTLTYQAQPGRKNQPLILAL
jgi:hypothetical protein